MGLEQLNFEGQNKIELAIATLQAWQPQDKPYQCCFSGGKDSVVIEHLCRRAGVTFDLVYSQTGIDPPELVYFIREHYPHVTIERPKFSLFEGIVRHGMPRRKGRWCCQLLKESGGRGRVLVTGIRAAESARRAKRCMVETKRETGKTYINPIFLWSDHDVWSYIRENNIPYCKLYDEGFDRLGCVLCPMTTPEHSLREWERWPKIADGWFRAGRRHWERKYPIWQAEGSRFVELFPTADEFLWWWLTRGNLSIEEIKYKAEKRGLRLPL